jgi:hypothetical protein
MIILLKYTIQLVKYLLVGITSFGLLKAPMYFHLNMILSMVGKCIIKKH